MSAKKLIKRAIVSVFDKSKLEILAHAFLNHDVEVISTGSTASVLSALGVNVTEVEKVTDFKECLDGRVKTLHPKIHAGILADLSVEKHVEQLNELEIKPFDLVVVNLYPFSETVSSGADFKDCIEKIDIGGPSMVRGAAKNHNNTAVVTDINDYETVAKAIENGGFSDEERFILAKKAFETTARYDVEVANWFNSLEFENDFKVNEETLPEWIGRTYSQISPLRYGENSHQSSALYSCQQKTQLQFEIANAVQISGKEMSYNNFVDADSALRAVYDFSEPTCAIVKHSNPCGIASNKEIELAFENAFACDPVSAFGGVIAFNSTVTAQIAEKIKSVFVEVIVAPKFEDAALELLVTKKNMRILQVEISDNKAGSPFEFKQISGGMLVQNADQFQSSGDDFENWELVSGEMPDEKTIADLEFAWKAVRAVKSNAIVLAKDKATQGIGMGQVNRLDSCDLAILRANTLASASQGSQINADNSTSILRAQNSVAASDAFFPFADGVQKLIDAGVKAIVQPGGSIRDDEVIAAAKKASVVMFLTKTRHFNH